jgi:serine/threonine protein kinase
MSLSVGTKVGPYEILAPIGAGGMGEVYRAHDSRLNRDVAIKTLPAAFAEDADRMARFQREAQVLAALNHPHIAGIYGIESSAIVMDGLSATTGTTGDRDLLRFRSEPAESRTGHVPPIMRCPELPLIRR